MKSTLKQNKFEIVFCFSLKHFMDSLIVNWAMKEGLNDLDIWHTRNN